ncbi:MAG: carbohydrate ABC transporter permease [Eubacteriales bacterium]|nr:carbohydrate ABC transporter permease [Eubacteriales bacterium]
MAVKTREFNKNNLIARSRGEKIFDAFNVILMLMLIMFFMFPIFNMISISLSDEYAVLRGDITVYPIGFNGTAYQNIFTNTSLWNSAKNSIIVAGLGCALGIVALCIAAYPLAFGNFYGKKLYNILILVTMWFNGGIIPTFLTISKLGLQNSLWSLILNSLLTAYYVVIVRSYFESLPKSIVESANIDGANDFRILFQLIMPLSKPVLATVALWIIVGHWNDFLNPLLFIGVKDKFTLQLILKEMVLNAESSTYSISLGNSGDTAGAAALGQQTRNAVLVVSMVPMVILYPFLQRYFISGITLGAVKG